MLHRLVQRQVLFDLLRITILAILAISGLLMVVGIMVEAARRGLDPLQIVVVMPFLIPPTLPYTLPTCLLFACTVVYGGMSSTNQITALKAAGINVLRVVTPAVTLSILLAGLGVYLSDQFIPACNRKLTELVLSDLSSNLYAYLHQQGSIVEDDFPYEIHVQTVRGDKLIRPIFKHRSPTGGGFDMLAQAEEATLEVVQTDENPESRKIVIRMIEGFASVDENNQSYTRDTVFEMPVPETIRRQETKMENLTFQGCYERSAERNRLARKLDQELAVTAAVSALSGDPAFFSGMIRQNTRTRERADRKSREAAAEVHLRIAQSAAAIPFILLGCPISILFQRREFLQTFFICFLPIITLYYPAMILAFNVFKEGQGELAMTLWSPTVALCLVAIPFLRSIIRH